MATVNWTAKTSRTSGISAEAIAAGANFIGSAIDNATNKDRYADISISGTCGVAPTVDKTVEVYLIFSDDGTSYEWGDASDDPKKTPIGIMAYAASTSEQILVLERVQIPPRPFKILLKSELDQSVTATVLCETYNESVA